MLPGAQVCIYMYIRYIIYAMYYIPYILYSLYRSMRCMSRCARWYKTVSGSRGRGVRPIYLVSSSSTGVVIPSICSPLSDLEKTVLRKYITVGSMSHTSCMSHFMYRYV